MVPCSTLLPLGLRRIRSIARGRSSSRSIQTLHISMRKKFAFHLCHRSPRTRSTHAGGITPPMKRYRNYDASTHEGCSNRTGAVGPGYGLLLPDESCGGEMPLLGPPGWRIWSVMVFLRPQFCAATSEIFRRAFFTFCPGLKKKSANIFREGAIKLSCFPETGIKRVYLLPRTGNEWRTLKSSIGPTPSSSPVNELVAYPR